jgi:hypothetical protein
MDNISHELRKYQAMSQGAVTNRPEEEKLLDAQTRARRAQFALNINKYMVWIAAIMAATSAERVISDWTRRRICMNGEGGEDDLIDGNSTSVS